MSKAANLFSKYFDDTEELDILSDDEGLVRIKGTVTLSDAIFKISIRRHIDENTISGDGKQLPRKPLYTGTISMVSPLDGSVLLSETKRRAREAAHRPYKNKDIYASKKFSCDTADIETIASGILRQVEKLFLENEEQYTETRLKYMSPEMLTPLIASTKYADDFLAAAYPSSSLERHDKRKRVIQKIFAKLPNKPMCKLRPRDINNLIKQNHITAENVHLCWLFWEYLLNFRKCSGKNPFPADSAREPSFESQDKKAFTSSELSQEVFDKVLFIINKKLSTVYCAVVLLLSGFSMEDIFSLKWGEIEFVPDYDDFAIIHIRKEYVVVAKHDYSRPAIPDAAKYLRRVYEDLCEKHGIEDVNSCHVATTEASLNKPLDRKILAEAANNVLVRAGYVGRLSTAGRPGENEPIPITLLRTNYQRMLYAKCGLRDDPDTFSFLSGVQFKSSTYMNYESHTSPEAQYRLYTILKPLSVEERIKKPVKSRETKSGLVYTAVPNTNHEATQVIGHICLAPGESITIRCPHGVTGRIEIS